MNKDSHLITEDEFFHLEGFYQYWKQKAGKVERAFVEQLFDHLAATGSEVQRIERLEIALRLLLNKAGEVKRPPRKFVCVIELCDRVLLGDDLSEADIELLESAKEGESRE